MPCAGWSELQNDLAYTQPRSHMSGFPNTNLTINNPNHPVLDSDHINTKTIQSGRICIYET